MIAQDRAYVTFRYGKFDNTIRLIVNGEHLPECSCDLKVVLEKVLEAIGKQPFITQV